jgi:hypothetical protein
VARSTGAVLDRPTPVNHHAMALRVGEPGRVYEISDARGVRSWIQADRSGIVRPTTTEEVRICDRLNLPYLSDAPRQGAGAPDADDTGTKE